MPCRVFSVRKQHGHEPYALGNRVPGHEHKCLPGVHNMAEHAQCTHILDLVVRESNVVLVHCRRGPTRGERP